MQNISPPSVFNRLTKCTCSLARTLINFWKSATLLRVRNSSSFLLRSRGCIMLITCSLCDHVIHPAVASSVTNVRFGSMRSSSWTPLIFSVRIRTSSKGRTSPHSAPTSAVQITQSDYTILTTMEVGTYIVMFIQFSYCGTLWHQRADVERSDIPSLRSLVVGGWTKDEVHCYGQWQDACYVKTVLIQFYWNKN